MRIQIVYENAWTICVVLKANGENPLLTDMPRNVWNVFAGTLQHISNAELGPRALPPNRNHALEGKIWQLSADHPYRAPYFYRPNRRVVITHVFAKRGGKRQDTPVEEIDKAQRAFAEYEHAEQNNQLQVEDSDD